MFGFFVGYVMGTRAGQEGLDQFVGTLRQIVGSGELKELVAGGIGLVGEALKAGTNAVSNGSPQLRRVS